MSEFDTIATPKNLDVLAPDGSEIRFLPVLDGGSMVHCRLPQGAMSQAVRHKTVEELWYVSAGEGRLWRRQGEREQVVELKPGTAHTIPLGTEFQFRCDSQEALEIVIVTMPPWPNMEEAEPVANFWTDGSDMDR